MRAGLMASAVAAACVVATAPAAWSTADAAERLLVQDRNLLVVVDQATACGDPVPITIRSADAGLFAEDSATRLQHTVDGVRAILGFECARTPKLDITGESGGKGNVVFRGSAGDASDWMVSSSERPTASTTAATSTGPLSLGGSGATSAAFAPAARQIVAGVSTGMTLPQARQAAAEEFGTTPQYRESRRIMVAAEGGCDFSADASPRPGWRCLEAAFTKSDPSLLYALGLSQAVDLDQRDSIVQSLTERFGAPEQSLRGQEPDGGNPYVFLSWGSVINGGHAGQLEHLNTPQRTLEAYAVARDGITVLSIWQQDPAVMQTAEEPEHRVKL